VNNDYHFISRWRVEGTCDEVADVLGDPLSLPRWWPSVYLAVWEVRPPEERLRAERGARREAGAPGPASESERGWGPASSDKSPIGQRVKLHTRGWLPYTLRWQSEVVESRYPNGFTLVATGDFDGRGEWTFAQNADDIDIIYDWRLRAEKPLLRDLSFLLKPVFEVNHRWAMARGEESLKLELDRRRAATKAARDRIPAPPGPVIYAGLGLLAAAAVVGGTLAYLALRATRRKSAS
jgi:hypothetical protein